jgi:hypothetical protein
MSGFFSVLTAILSLSCLIGTIFAARIAIRARDSQLELPRSLASRIKSLEQSVEETQSALTDVANRVKMMRVRNAANHVGNGAADPYQNPDKWRAEMNRKLAFSKLQKG